MDDIISSIEKRLKTLMIGSISRFENSFGYLWNHGDEPTNDSQYFFRDKWDELREDLLNHGNYQIRQALKDLDTHLDNNRYKYHYKFQIRQPRQGE